MSFLAPAFLAGLAAIAIPLILHLIQRERKKTVAFPSLMFVRRIPYQSVRRRRIRNWLLLAMRAAAIALIVAAFARPFTTSARVAAASGGGAREIVVLLDTSASMAYGDRWQRAQAAADRVLDGLGGDDRATLVLFARNAEEHVRATPDRVRLAQAVHAARPGAGATRYGPALKLAQSILARTTQRRREAILISDFQKTGWSADEDTRFAEGVTLTPVSVASPGAANLSVASVTFARAVFSGQERVTVTAGLVNHATQPAANVPVVLEIDGHQIETRRADVAPNAAASVSFVPFTLAEANVHGTVRAGSDAMPQDNAFDFVLTPGRPVSILVVDGSADRNATLYLSRALSIGTTPTFQIDVVPAARAASTALDRRSVVILNDTTVPPALSGGTLDRFVQRGGGLLVALGEHSAWPADNALLPGRVGATVDRLDGRGGALGFIDYSHPVFELFKAPHSGDFSAARILRYRSLTPAPGDRVLARFDDGAVAAAERHVGRGRVIAWTSTLDDSWNDLALKPVYLPVVHQLARYLAEYREPAAWRTVGQVVDLATASGTRVVLTPSGRRIDRPASDRPEFLELDEKGFYEIRTRGADERRPLTVAADIDPTESDLSSLDPQELVAAVTGHATEAAADAAASPPTPAELERRQAIWWYLMLAGVFLLIAETIVSNRTSIRV